AGAGVRLGDGLVRRRRQRRRASGGHRTHRGPRPRGCVPGPGVPRLGGSRRSGPGRRGADGARAHRDRAVGGRWAVGAAAAGLPGRSGRAARRRRRLDVVDLAGRPRRAVRMGHAHPGARRPGERGSSAPGARLRVRGDPGAGARPAPRRTGALVRSPAAARHRGCPRAGPGEPAAVGRTGPGLGATVPPPDAGGGPAARTVSLTPYTINALAVPTPAETPQAPREHRTPPAPCTATTTPATPAAPLRSRAGPTTT